jgi:hypothetical protein
MPITLTDQQVRDLQGLLQRIRDDSADLEQAAGDPNRVRKISLDIDVDTVNALNLLQRAARGAG